MKTRRFFSILLLFFAGPLLADSTSPEVPTRFGHFLVEYRLNDDSSHVEYHELEMTVLKERAVERAKQTSITYSTSIQKAEVSEAYTRKADGRRLDVPKNNFQVEVNTGRDKNAPVFSDMTTLTVVFPEVAVGDTLVLKYKITQTEPMFPGKFSMSGTFPRIFAYDDVTVRFSVPTTLFSQYEGRHMAEQITEKEGRKIVEWKYQNKEPIKSERRNNSVYDPEREAGYAITTFRSYAEIAEAYGTRARPKVVVTERIRKLADEIVAGKKTPRKEARALYDWVATNISYAGNCIGVGAVVPHDITFILDNRMGDCKDHATLLQTLLAARKIESTQALINARAGYRLPRIPVVSTVNHVINYIPALDLYADSTAETIPFGMLPFNVADKPVLLVDDFRESTRTPAQAVGENQQHMKTVAKIRPDGSVTGQVEITQKGIYAVNTRAWIRKMPKEDEEEIVKTSFQRQGRMGSGMLEPSDAKELLNSYDYKVRFDMQDFVDRPGAGAFRIEPFFYSAAPVAGFARSAVISVEEVDVTCSNGSSVEEYVYELPKGMKLLSVPDNLSIKNDSLSYRATYKLKGNTLTVKRVFDDNTRGNVCSPAVIKANQEFAKKVLPNVRAQVVYR